jgi:signal peptidase I
VNNTSKKETAVQKSGIRENIEACLVAIILALLIRSFVVQAFKIPSGSMLETLQIGDHILVNKFIYGIKIPFLKSAIISGKKPEHDDVIVFIPPHDPDKDFIKRVVGVEGDVVEIRDKQLYINNKKITGGYEIFSDPSIMPKNSSRGIRDNFGPVIVPANSLFCMGDNRDTSYDSRFWGFVDLKAVKGKAFMIYWSWNSKNSGSFLNYVRWNRFGQIID